MPVGYSIYIEKPSYVHQRIDPRTKLFALCTSFVLALLFNNPAFLGVLLVAVLAIGLWAKLPLKSFRSYLIFALWFLILGVVIWPFYIQQGPVVIRVGSALFTSAGLLFGFAMGLRVALMVCCWSLDDVNLATAHYTWAAAAGLTIQGGDGYVLYYPLCSLD